MSTAIGKVPKAKKKHGPGRPATGHGPNVALRVPADLLEIIDRIAKIHQVTRSEIMRNALIHSLSWVSSDDERVGKTLGFMFTDKGQQQLKERERLEKQLKDITARVKTKV